MIEHGEEPAFSAASLLPESTGIRKQAPSTGASPNVDMNHRANSDILRRFRIRKTSLQAKPD